MTHDLIVRQARVPVPPDGDIVPTVVMAAGERASLRSLEFFAAAIRNLHTRAPTFAL